MSDRPTATAKLEPSDVPPEVEAEVAPEPEVEAAPKRLFAAR